MGKVLLARLVRTVAAGGLAVAAVLAGTVATAPPAAAHGGVRFSFGFGFPGFFAAPVYAAPPVVYAPPVVVYEPPPVVYWRPYRYRRVYYPHRHRYRHYRRYYRCGC